MGIKKRIVKTKKLPSRKGKTYHSKLWYRVGRQMVRPLIWGIKQRKKYLGY